MSFRASSRSLRLLEQFLRATSEQMRVRSSPSLVSCLRVPDHVSPTRLFVDTLHPDTLLAFRGLLRDRTATVLDSASSRFGSATKKFSETQQGLTVATTTPTASARETIARLVDRVNVAAPRLASVGQNTLLLIRSPVARAQLTRLSQALRPSKRRPGALLAQVNGSAALVLIGADTANRQIRTQSPDIWILELSPASKSLWQRILRMLCSDSGPRRIGIGWIPPNLQPAAVFAVLSSLMLFISSLFPLSLLWVAWSCAIMAVVMFATRPDCDSFIKWTKQKAPDVVKSKELIVDKVRAAVTPYVMQWLGNGPAVSDYGLVSVVTMKDAADFVYVYVGLLSRWCLLGWYNAEDEYEYGILLKQKQPQKNHIQAVSSS